MVDLSALLHSHNIKYYAVCDNVLLFLAPYRPFLYPEHSVKIDSYYLTSNATHNIEMSIMSALNKDGVSAVRYHGTDLRSKAAKCGLGIILKSGFLYCDAFGTFVYIGSLQLDGQFDLTPHLPQTQKRCADCDRCQAACPTAAVFTDKALCLRRIQEDAHKSPSDCEMAILAKFETLLGCNLCQTACPLNSHIPPTKPPAELTEALNRLAEIHTLRPLTNADLAPLKPLIGANYARPSKLNALLTLIPKP